MTVRELIDALEDFGDHLPVAIRIERGNHTMESQEIDVAHDNGVVQISAILG